MEGSFDKFFTEDQLAKTDKPENGAPPPAPAAATPAPEPDAKPDKKTLPDLDKQYEGMQKLETPQDKGEVKGGAKELRAAYESTKAELAKRDATIAELQKQVEATRSGKVAEDSKAWETERERYNERIKALEGEIAAADFTKSTEFQEQYQKPINETYRTFANRVKQLKVIGDDGESRAATQDDLDHFLSMPLEQAIEEAERFGKAAPMVMQWRERLEELVGKKTSEIARRREKGGEFLTEQQKAQQEIAKGYKSAYETRWKTQVEKLPQLYGPDETDKEGNAILEQDRGLIDFAFEPDPESKPQDVATARAEVGLRAMAFRRTMHRLNAAKQEITALKEKLAAYENSQPGPGVGSNGAARKPTDKHIWDGIDSIPGV